MSDLPCKKCLCLAICRSKYIQDVGDLGSYFVSLLKPLAISTMFTKCSILENYLLIDRHHYTKYKIIKWLIKKIGIIRCEEFHQYMTRKIK